MRTRLCLLAATAALLLSAGCQKKQDFEITFHFPAQVTRAGVNLGGVTLYYETNIVNRQDLTVVPGTLFQDSVVTVPLDFVECTCRYTLTAVERNNDWQFDQSVRLTAWAFDTDSTRYDTTVSAFPLDTRSDWTYIGLVTVAFP